MGLAACSDRPRLSGITETPESTGIRGTIAQTLAHLTVTPPWTGAKPIAAKLDVVQICLGFFRADSCRFFAPTRE